MQELEPSWNRVIAVWWLIFWRGTLGGVLLGGVVGFIEGFIGGMLGASPQSITLVTSISGGVVGFAWFIMVVRMALRKHYGDFRIALVPNT
jgi:hypothetical protein